MVPQDHCQCTVILSAVVEKSTAEPKETYKV
jgi:hypothetical protein